MWPAGVSDREAADCHEIATAMTRRRLLRIEEVVELAAQMLDRLQGLHGRGVFLGRVGPSPAAPQPPGAAPDARADVWCAGAVLFQALALQTPTVPAPALQDVRRDLPPWLCAAVDRALQKDPAGRWPTAREMSEALRAGAASATMDLDWEQHEDRTVGISSPLEQPAPRRSTPAPAPPPAVQWRSRSRRVRVLDLLLLPPAGALLGVIIGAWISVAPWADANHLVHAAYGLLGGSVIAGLLLWVRTKAGRRPRS
jgi:hypothetical protein